MVYFGVAGVEHPHAATAAYRLIEAGAKLGPVYSECEARANEIIDGQSTAHRVRNIDEVLADPQVDLIVCGVRPRERPLVSSAALKSGKAVLSTKPAAIDDRGIANLKDAIQSTGGIFRVFFTEVLDNNATVTALKLYQDGAIGALRQIRGSSPHRLAPFSRPRWMFHKVEAGGILADLASHQAYQFLRFAQTTDATVLTAHVTSSDVMSGIRMETLGSVRFRAGEILGASTVDWLTPDGSPSWGDGRLYLLGDEGVIEVYKNGDPRFPNRGPVIVLTNHEGVDVVAPGEICSFAVNFLSEVSRGKLDAVEQARAIAATAMAVTAQKIADEYAIPQAATKK